MSATNKTTYYELPVFIATDEPKWLTDWNGAMNIIDGAIAEAKTAADNAQTTANANALAISGLSDSVSTMSTTLGTLTGNVTTLTGNVQRINELIGNGTPTTTDKTIIGAINELKAAIDALAPGGEVSAAEVSYDNTDSGLVADDVQDAIDELNTKIEAIQPGGNVPDFNFVNSSVATVTPKAGGSLDTNATDVRSLLNADASIGKIYGSIIVTCEIPANAGWHTVATISNAGLPTIAESYNIIIGSNLGRISGGTTYTPSVQRLVFNTNGTVDVQTYSQNSGANTITTYVSLPPCIYFLKDLGD